MTTVAVDFDGVIHSYDRGWADGSIYGELVPGAVEALECLTEQHAVFIHTSRDADAVAEWLNEHAAGRLTCVAGGPDSGFWNNRDKILVTNRKLIAIAYIDDRAIRFRNWAQALTELNQLES